MTCSLQPHLVVTFFHSSPFLVCLSGEKILCLSNQTNLQTTLPVWKFIEWSYRSPNHHGEKTPGRPSQPRPSLVSHVLFIGTTCFHMGTIATGQACYFAEGDSSFLKKNCGQTALIDGLFLTSFLSIHKAHEKTLSSLFCRVSLYPMHGGSRFPYRSCLYLTYLSLPCVYNMLFYPLSCKLLVQLILPRHLRCDLLIFLFVVSIRIYLHTQEPEAVTTKPISVSKNEFPKNHPHPQGGTWKIIPLSKWLNPQLKAIRAIWKGVPQTYLGDL